ncbi:Hpt domain-containing protein [Arthrobacter sp. CDRTa11]|uniref:Hpt domain-containing protein n=1 Tax=Arthrobacter sp. CDRTa11 TaxID=2651199 RepID=UPI002265C74F|nr:Hpt domain-containing protein [Arthrobacter sp. CDRTa11]
MHIPDPTSGDRGVSADALPAGSGAGVGSRQPYEGEELLPLVDSAVLEDLEEQLNGSELAVRFARDYTAMWDQRYSRLAAAVLSEDRASALDAAISLKITSAMVGGLRLARLAELLEKVIRQGDFGQGQALMEQVAEDGGQTVSELQANYILKN